jgi:hypothetical protein
LNIEAEKKNEKLAYKDESSRRCNQKTNGKYERIDEILEVCY